MLAKRELLYAASEMALDFAYYITEKLGGKAQRSKSEMTRHTLKLSNIEMLNRDSNANM